MISKISISLGVALAVFASPVFAAEKMADKSMKMEEGKAKVSFIDANGMGKKAGKVIFKDGKDGLKVKVMLKGLTPGEHGFHVHENSSCDPAEQNGTKVPGLAAGGHYDPDKTGKHMGPAKGGHKGDMPLITADASGNVEMKATVPGITLKDIRGKALIIHSGGDNYADVPAPLGGGGARVACGIIE